MMYGQETLNGHNVLRYGWTLDFFHHFRSLTADGLSLPPMMQREFHQWIRPYVDKYKNDPEVTAKLAESHRFYTVRDVQRELGRLPQPLVDGSNNSDRRSILTSPSFLPFIEEYLKDQSVILIVNGVRDAEKLSHQIPDHCQICHLTDWMQPDSIKKKLLAIWKITEDLVAENQHHLLFRDPSFHHWLRSRIRHKLLLLYTYQRIIHHYSIGAVLDQTETMYPITLTAAHYGIPFILAPQVFVSDRSILPIRASHVCVWGPNYEKWFRRRGIPAHRIHTVGNVSFERKRLEPVISQAEFRKRLGISPEHRILVFASQFYGETVNQTLTRWIAYAMEGLPITCILLPHPSDETDYSEISRHPPFILPSRSVTSLYDCLANMDALMTISSNTAVEAAMFGKGVFILQPPLPYLYEHTNNDSSSLLVQSNAGITIRNQEELRRSLRHFIEKPNYRTHMKHLAKSFLSQTMIADGSSGIRLRKVILKALQEGR
ncbi:hypothetical protein [Desmospora profundinema]|uniref:UDP-N-acetylglucosamine 2-epimerase domain-containing protein n=1 Tax=Desmospora profundinema TaxID=1571184 RepID=A0ABU1IRT8_9BACL|nr:hypothetical protein [Desmospora profundinema]MDR6227503.1 hypothetical protein [Desmospora profundinema]